MVYCVENWGPPDEELLQHRKNFCPQKKTKYFYTKVRCPHTCLLHAKQLREEIKVTEDKIAFFEAVYQHELRIELTLRQKIKRIAGMKRKAAHKELAEAFDVKRKKSNELQHLTTSLTSLESIAAVLDKFK